MSNNDKDYPYYEVFWDDWMDWRDNFRDRYNSCKITKNPNLEPQKEITKKNKRIEQRRKIILNRNIYKLRMIGQIMKTNKGYIRLSGKIECPYSDKRGRVFEHRYIWWKEYGEKNFIEKDEVIHHKNKEKGDN